MSRMETALMESLSASVLIFQERWIPSPVFPSTAARRKAQT
jgi:hypothetical protein